MFDDVGFFNPSTTIIIIIIAGHKLFRIPNPSISLPFTVYIDKLNHGKNKLPATTMAKIIFMSF